MRADYLSYARGTRTSLLGLVIQLGMALALLGYGFLGGDAAARMASVFALAGVPVWLTLAVLFDQHRRERIEAIESESFAASDAATASVFEQAEDIHVAAKRLRGMYRFLLPAVSLTVAALLIGYGLWRFNTARNGLESFVAPARLRGWGIAISLVVAFVGFMFARYCSALSRERVWANLRGGAGFAVGTALFGLALGVAHFVVLVGAPSSILKYLTVVFPAAMVLLGGEIVLNFVFEMYRPRKAGELPRPAFDSWLLGLVAAPDRIAQRLGEALNYQLGYDVSGSWFFKLLGRTTRRVLVPLAIVVVWGLTGLVVIRPHERAMVLRFGDYSREIGPGLHVKYPWPIETVDIPVYTRRNAQGKVEFKSRTVTGVRSIDIGTPPPPAGKAVLWGNDHALEEVFFLVQPEKAGAAQEDGEEGAGIELAMVAAELPLHYAVDDVQAYDRLAPPEMRDDLLKSVAQRAAMQYLATRTVGDMLSGRQTELQEQVRQRIERAFIDLNPLQNGKPVVQVLYVGLHGVHPHKDTVMAFEQVVGQEQKFQAQLKDAEGNAIRVLTLVAGNVELANDIVRELDRLESMPATTSGRPSPELTEQQLKIRSLIQRAGGRSAAIILEASADRWARHMGERARLSAYQGQLATYRAAPALYRASRYLDALKEAIATARVYIVDPNAALHTKFNFEDRENQLDVFKSQESQ
jgi:modulator of FtsH protease HflK